MISEQQRKELHEAAKPILKWLNDNMHPHAEVHIGNEYVALVEAIVYIPDANFVKE